MLTKKKPAPKKPAKASSAAVANPAPTPEEPRNPTHISAGTTIEGNIVSADDLIVDGTVRGDIRTASKLVIGPKSIVEGNIFANNAEIAGQITGAAECQGQLTIRSTCVIEGDIVTKSLNVESGSSFNGQCRVGEAAKRSPDAESTPDARMAGSALDD